MFVAQLVMTLRPIAGVTIAISGDAPKSREDWPLTSFTAFLINSCHLGVIVVEGDFELGILGSTQSPSPPIAGPVPQRRFLAQSLDGTKAVAPVWG